MAGNDAEQILSDIEAIRNRLADSLDELVDRSNPKNIAARQADKFKAKFKNPDGSARLDVVVPIAAGVVGVIGLAIVGRRLFKN